MIDLYFTLFATIAVACGVGVLCTRHPINGAVNLIGVMLGLSGIYALLASPFLAVVQILVYAGAVMMLVVFVIMVLNGARDGDNSRFGSQGLLGLIVPVVFAIIAAVLMTNLGDVLREAGDQATVGDPTAIARTMFDVDAASSLGYYLLFEIVGLVLLVAVVGAVLLAKRDLATPRQITDESSQEAGH
jgi:NADH-quinone oxidoreductase subunit J